MSEQISRHGYLVDSLFMQVCCLQQIIQRAVVVDHTIADMQCVIAASDLEGQLNWSCAEYIPWQILQRAATVNPGITLTWSGSG